MARIHLDAIGGSARHEHFHRTREMAAVVAALAGGLAFLGLAVAVLTGIAPSDSVALWVGVVVCGCVFLTGLWWRSDAPDARDRHYERERRGF